jgi:hypothetical protein
MWGFKEKTGKFLPAHCRFFGEIFFKGKKYQRNDNRG